MLTGTTLDAAGGIMPRRKAIKEYASVCRAIVSFYRAPLVPSIANNET